MSKLTCEGYISAFDNDVDDLGRTVVMVALDDAPDLKGTGIKIGNGTRVRITIEEI